MVSLLARLILQKGDNTEVSLANKKRLHTSLTSVDKTKLSEISKQFILMISETSPEQLEEYLEECLEFIENLTSTPAFLYLGLDAKAKLEVTLVNILSVSQLKVAMSCLRTTTTAKFINISANLLATTSVKEQAESPLLFALLSFQAK